MIPFDWLPVVIFLSLTMAHAVTHYMTFGKKQIPEIARYSSSLGESMIFLKFVILVCFLGPWWSMPSALFLGVFHTTIGYHIDYFMSKFYVSKNLITNDDHEWLWLLVNQILHVLNHVVLVCFFINP